MTGKAPHDFKLPRQRRLSYVLSAVFLLVCITFLSFRENNGYQLNLPEGWPKPEYNFRRNQPNKEIIELGRVLFYDPVLSADSTISCASCHSPYTAFTHVDHATSHGILDRIGKRNSPALVNLAWNSSFMWDGSVRSLDQQAAFPIENHDEMDESLPQVVRKLDRMEKYRNVFQTAFGTTEITREKVLYSLSQFMLTLVSNNSKYDKVMRKEPGATFTESEAKGYELFKANCASCHSEPLFTNNSFRNNGLEPDARFDDKGRMTVTGKAEDSYKFRVPTLRNIERSAPYMHDGRYKNLQMVLFHYSSAIHQSPTLSPSLKNGIQLNEQEKGQVIAFLKTLTDNQFLTNPAFRFKQL